jgi:regulatory protein RepA
MTDNETMEECLRQIPPSALDYDEWLQVGCAIKNAGGTVDMWDSWSRPDSRYKAGEASRKWNTLRGSSNPVGIGTLVKLCRENGGEITMTGAKDNRNCALEWDDEISFDLPKSGDHQVIRQEWLQDKELPQIPANYSGVNDLVKYLSTLFSNDEFVGISADAYKSDPDAEGKVRLSPKKGDCSRSAGQLIDELNKCKGDLNSVIGDYPQECGAWIRFNPFDGVGITDGNVTSFRYALVESDEISIEKQYAIYKELELPIAALVHSGGKSLHAIVRIEAVDFKEYQKRVDFLYEVCKKNGLMIDRKNRNPSRLSRLPGAIRNKTPQRLIDTNIGQPTWKEWEEWIDALNDELPDAENLATRWDNQPPLAGTVIDGLLRHGHKMLIAGPSKAGKSFALIELAIAIAEGSKWLGWQCSQGRVLYVNLELDGISCLHRFKDVYSALNLRPDNISNIDIWNLRGKSMPMDKLAPRLIRRAAKKKYIAVIIDPIYKVITGDENSAHEMSNFCNQFDRICSELGTATIYCHHHSKGAQGNKKSNDRASGSGVFARDPDATLDIIELMLDEPRRTVITDRHACDKIAEMLNKELPTWHNIVAQDDSIVIAKLLGELQGWEDPKYHDMAQEIYKKERLTQDQFTAWRIEGTLREFPSFPACRCMFQYPVHIEDRHDLLKDAKAEGEELFRRTKDEAIKDKTDKLAQETLEAYRTLKTGDDPVTVKEMAEYFSISEKATRQRISKYSKQIKLHYDNGFIFQGNCKNEKGEK